MKSFFGYFFGQGTETEFSDFTLAHLAPILLMIALILLICRFREQIRNSRHEEKLRYALAFIMIISEMSFFNSGLAASPSRGLMVSLASVRPLYRINSATARPT